MRPFFQEVHRRIFGANTSVFIVFSAPEGRLSLLDDLRPCQGYTTFALHDPVPQQAPMNRLNPVLVVEPEIIVSKDIPEQSVPEYLAKIPFSDMHARCHLAYVDKFRACELYDAYFAHKPHEPHFWIVETSTGTDNVHALRAGERLCTVTFGLTPAYS